MILISLLIDSREPERLRVLDELSQVFFNLIWRSSLRLEVANHVFSVLDGVVAEIETFLGS